MRAVENIQALVELKPDFIGFIFYDKSPRFIGNDVDAGFINSIPKEIKKVGVFVNASIDFILQNVIIDSSYGGKNLDGYYFVPRGVRSEDDILKSPFLKKIWGKSTVN